MTRKTGAYIVMIAGILLLFFNVFQLDFSNLFKGPFSGIVSNILLIVAMMVSIKDINKENKHS